MSCLSVNVMYCCLLYCKFRNFRENFIFGKSIKLYICNVKKLQLEQDFSTSVNSRVISPFHEGCIFAKMKFCENKTLAKFSEFTVGPFKNNFCATELLLFSYQSVKICVIGARKNYLIELVLLSTHSI